MTNEAFDPQVEALLDANAKAWAEASLDQGHGYQGWWPPAGEHEFLVTGFSTSKGPFRFMGKESATDAVKIQFHLQLIPNESSPDYDPNDPDNSRAFDGKEFQIPGSQVLGTTNDDFANDLAQKDRERLKAHIAVILNQPKETLDNTPLSVLLTQCRSVIEGPSQLQVQGKVVARQSKKSSYVDYTEYFLKNLSVAP